jgi:hypothetical protein
MQHVQFRFGSVRKQRTISELPCATIVRALGSIVAVGEFVTNSFGSQSGELLNDCLIGCHPVAATASTCCMGGMMHVIVTLPLVASLIPILWETGVGANGMKPALRQNFYAR